MKKLICKYSSFVSWIIIRCFLSLLLRTSLHSVGKIAVPSSETWKLETRLPVQTRGKESNQGYVRFLQKCALSHIAELFQFCNSGFDLCGVYLPYFLIRRSFCFVSPLSRYRLDDWVCLWRNVKGCVNVARRRLLGNFNQDIIKHYIHSIMAR